MRTINTTIKGAEKCIVNMENFKASSLTGRNLKEGVYAVFSYREPIACFIKGQGWYLTEKRFSVTTSRHTHIVKIIVRKAHVLTEEIRTLVIQQDTLN